MAKPLFTIGYEQGGQADLCAALLDAGVRSVIDVRALANSRRAGFSKRLLAGGLNAAGMDYIHLKELGTPKAGRDANRRGDMAAFWRIVDEALARPEAGLALEQARAIARAGPTALLCLEHDPACCHRLRVAEQLAADGAFTIVHLAPRAP